MIYLRVGRLEVDWGKNNGFADHSPLFQPQDLADIPYFYVDRAVEADLDEAREVVESEEGYRWLLLTEMAEGFSKPLLEVVDRIEMLGHTDKYARWEFAYLANLNSFDDAQFTFDELAQVLREVDVAGLSIDYGEGGDAFGKFFRREVFPKLPFEEIAANPSHVRYDAAEAMENLSPYTILRLLADNPTARELSVIWQFRDVFEGGWAERSHFVHPLEPRYRFSILTEGSSDVRILRKALELLEPHIADFFSFVEVEARHPFSGTGQVVNFLKGLVDIGVQNNVIAIFDNDAEGVAAWRKCLALNLPDNVRVLKLPDLTEFEAVPMTGPTGRQAADINGRAASIECYLDLGDDPQLRWSNYNSHIHAYQGELLDKERYKAEFLRQTAIAPDYDYNKMRRVLGALKTTAVEMRSAQLLADPARESGRASEEER